MSLSCGEELVGLHLKPTVAEMVLFSWFVKLVLMTSCFAGGGIAGPASVGFREVGDGVDEGEDNDEVVMEVVVDDRPLCGFGEHQAARGESVSRKMEKCILFDLYVCGSFALVMISPCFSLYISECCFATVFCFSSYLLTH